MLKATFTNEKIKGTIEIKNKVEDEKQIINMPKTGGAIDYLVLNIAGALTILLGVSLSFMKKAK